VKNTSLQGDKGKRPTKFTAFARRAKAAENPHKKRSRKQPAETEDVETAHPESQPCDGDSTLPVRQS
jgi:hypothetical protein